VGYDKEKNLIGLVLETIENEFGEMEYIRW